MIRSDKKLAELSRILDYGNHDEIEALIGTLRNEEPFEGAIGKLASHYDRKADHALRQVIASFFNDLKEGKEEVIEVLTSPLSLPTLAMIASSCWQSGLDYSEHALTFTEVYLKGDYILSLECFTVLDTWSGMISGREKEIITGKLEKALGEQEEVKQKLTHELIKVLSL